MRFTRTVGFSALTLALALSAGPALAAPPDPVRNIEVSPFDPNGPVRDWPGCPRGTKAVWVDREFRPAKLKIDPFTGKITFYEGQDEFHGWDCQPT